MKKLFKIMLAVYSTMLLSVYLKLLPNPSDFFITRDTILTRRERGFWQFNFIPFASYFHIGENFPTIYGSSSDISDWQLCGEFCLHFLSKI